MARRARRRGSALRYTEPGTMKDRLDQIRRVRGLLYDAGFMRYGWPERVGGLGGVAMMRTEPAPPSPGGASPTPVSPSLIEVLGPTMVDYAPPELAAEMMPRLLSGEELWCQGFSEPGSGSDLASLSCRATPNLGPNGGDPETATTWTINGQKVWTSIADHSERCVLLTRTGTPESRHRGITAFFVDMDTPGITARPIEMINGEAEFCEVFFDDVQVPADRICGGVNGGWAVAMSILPFERSSCFWSWVSYEQHKLQKAVELAPDDDRAAEALGAAYLQWYAFRAQSRRTQLRMAAGEPLGAETSIDKVLVAMSEHATYDAVRKVLGGAMELDDDNETEMWRKHWIYSRASTIYGGTGEVQRNIIARRLLELGDEA
ncbi:MAG: acyl-CoA dehydrogenase family protein [Acidimicrobiia bacterium]